MLEPHKNYHYEPGMSRRESLKWLGLLVGGTAVSSLAACSTISTVVSGDKGHWPDLQLAPVTAKGYGQDPNLLMPPESPWPRTMTMDQLTLVALVSDIIVPREGNFPCASEAKVPDVVDEWVSAPYSEQQKDRVTILSILAWLDDEASLRYKKPYAVLDKQQQMSIVNDIAFSSDTIPSQFERATEAFSRLRALIVAAYFCSPPGSEDIGYMGNIAIAGDYPGPTAEAQAHLDTVLAELGLTEYAYQD